MIKFWETHEKILATDKFTCSYGKSAVVEELSLQVNTYRLIDSTNDDHLELKYEKAGILEQVTLGSYVDHVCIKEVSWHNSYVSEVDSMIKDWVK